MGRATVKSDMSDQNTEIIKHFMAIFDLLMDEDDTLVRKLNQ